MFKTTSNIINKKFQHIHPYKNRHKNHMIYVICVLEIITHSQPVYLNAHARLDVRIDYIATLYSIADILLAALSQTPKTSKYTNWINIAQIIRIQLNVDTTWVQFKYLYILLDISKQTNLNWISFSFKAHSVLAFGYVFFAVLFSSSGWACVCLIEVRWVRCLCILPLRAIDTYRQKYHTWYITCV